MNSYHVVRISGEDGRKVQVTEGGMTLDEANDKAAELRETRPAGSSDDYRAREYGSR